MQIMTLLRAKSIIYQVISLFPSSAACPTHNSTICSEERTFDYGEINVSLKGTNAFVPTGR